MGQARGRHHREGPKISTVLSALYRRRYEEWNAAADPKKRWAQRQLFL